MTIKCSINWNGRTSRRFEELTAKKGLSEGQTTVLRFSFISYLWLKHTSFKGFFFTSPGGRTSWVKAAHGYGNRNREEEKNLAEIKTAHKDEKKSAARLRVADERKGAACEVYFKLSPSEKFEAPIEP